MVGPIVQGVKAGIGLFQMLKESGMAKNIERPEMDIPDSATESLDLARAEASQTLLPGQGYYETKMDRGRAQTLGAMRESAGSPSQLMDAAIGLNQQSSDQMLNMAIAGAERKDRKLTELQRNLGTMANWEQLQFETNEMQPYKEKAALASSLLGAGMQNVFGAADSLGAIFAAKENNNAMNERLQMILSGTGGDGTNEAPPVPQSMSEALTNPAPTSGAVPQSQSAIMSMLNKNFGNMVAEAQSQKLLGHLPNLFGGFSLQ